ncbi:MAG: hypothetical protein JWN37_932 [Candidatus Nomurabacteria bacterium]|nr:hypothetical protein [Candidatus Nomurabacteria bacterium]
MFRERNMKLVVCGIESYGFMTWEAFKSYMMPRMSRLDLSCDINTKETGREGWVFLGQISHIEFPEYQEYLYATDFPTDEELQSLFLKLVHFSQEVVKNAVLQERSLLVYNLQHLLKPAE